MHNNTPRKTRKKPAKTAPKLTDLLHPVEIAEQRRYQRAMINEALGAPSPAAPSRRLRLRKGDL